MLFYIVEWIYLSPNKDFNENDKGFISIIDNNPSSVGMITQKEVYCLDLGEDEYAIGISRRLRLVVKKEDVSDEYTDSLLTLFQNGWLNFYIFETETTKMVETHDRFAISLLTTSRKSNIIHLSHNGYNKIGKVENKFVLDVVRHGSYGIKAPDSQTVYWYTLRVPIVPYKNDIHVLNNILQALKYMYTTKHVIYNSAQGIYNGLLDPYSFSIGFEDSREMLKMIIDVGKDHSQFSNIYDQVKKTAESAAKDDVELLYKITTIYDIFKFIDTIYDEYADSYSVIMKEYLEAIFKSRVPEKSPIEITIIDFESKYKKKIED